MASVIRGNDNFDSSNAGPSTDFNAVGTYCLVANNASIYWTTTGSAGGTRSGSTLGLANPYTKTTNGPLPGTWRQMQGTHYSYHGPSHWGLFVRIS